MEALAKARRIPCAASARLAWQQADLFNRSALAEADLVLGSPAGVVEHTCFCAIDPAQRQAYVDTVVDLLAPGGWLLALFWCHGQPVGRPLALTPRSWSRCRGMRVSRPSCGAGTDCGALPPGNCPPG